MIPIHALSNRGRPQPQGVAHARPLESPQLVPGEDQDQDELPHEPRGEADQQRLSEWLIAPELVPEPGGDDPGKNAHGDGCRRPHRKDLSERVLPHGGIPRAGPVLRVLHQRRTPGEATDIAAASGCRHNLALPLCPKAGARPWFHTARRARSIIRAS